VQNRELVETVAHLTRQKLRSGFAGARLVVAMLRVPLAAIAQRDAMVQRDTDPPDDSNSPNAPVSVPE